MKISVIVPAYNEEKTIERCLHSILRNTYQNLEVICINDGSTDRTAEILAEVAERDARVKIVTQENAGLPSARNRGLEIVSGEFITFIDADDWIHREYFQCLFESSIKNNADITVCGYCNVNDEMYGSENEICKPISVRTLSQKEWMKNFHVKTYVWGKLIKCELIGAIRFEEDLQFGEDSAFMMEILCKTPKVQINLLDEVLYYYYQKSEFTGRFAKSEAYLPMIDKFFKYANSLNISEDMRLFIAEEIVKKLLIYRYEAEVEKNFQEVDENFWGRFHSLKKDISKLAPDKRFKFRVFALFPSFYRMMRIMKDRTLLEWEKRKRELMDIL